MSLNDVFQNAAAVAFRVFDSLAEDVTYIRSGDDLGWGDGASDAETVLRVIPISIQDDTVKKASFYNLIQPKDVVVMIKGAELREKSVVVRVSDTVRMVLDGMTRVFDIQASDTDPAKAVYLVLLRSAKVQDT